MKKFCNWLSCIAIILSSIAICKCINNIHSKYDINDIILIILFAIVILYNIHLILTKTINDD